MESERLILYSREIEAALATTEVAYSKRAKKAIEKIYTSGIKWKYNFAFVLVDILTSALMAQEPHWIANPLNKDGEEIQPIVEKVLKYYSVKLKLRRKLRKLALWSIITGTGIAKVGYWKEDLAELGEPVGGEVGDIYLSILDPRDWFGDPYGQDDDLSDFRYCGERLRMPLAAIKENKAYDPVVAARLVADEIGKSYPEERRNEEVLRTAADLPDEYALKTAYEFYLRKRNRGIEFTTFAHGEKEPLSEPKDFPKQFSDYPYVPLQFYPIIGKFYGDSILEQMEGVFEFFNGIMNRIEESWKNAINKTFVNKQGLDSAEVGVDAVKSKAQHNIVFTNTAPADVVKQVQGSLTSADELQLLNLTMDMIQRISGLTYMDMMQSSSRTATEAAGIQSSSNLRTSLKMTIMEDAAAEIGKRIWRIARYIKDELPVKEILGEEDAAVWDAYEARQSNKERQGLDSDISVRMGVSVTPAQIGRRNVLLELLRSVTQPEVLQVMQMQQSIPDIAKIVNKVADDSGLVGSIVLPLQTAPEEGGEGGESGGME